MKFVSKKLVALCFLVLAVSIFVLVRPRMVKSAALTSASVTLSNSRLSYFAKTTGTHAAADSTIDIATSGNSDNNTSHLFPNDGVSVGVNGGRTVARIVDSDTFALNTPLTVGAAAGQNVYATQSGAVTVAFTLASQIPANGYIRITIPDPASGGNDGAPDTGASIALSGWDLNSIAAADITVSGGTGCSWNATETITAGSGSSHFIDATTTAACTAGTVTVAIDASPGLVNPAAISSGHTAGTADVYQWTVSTYDGDPAGAGVILDTTDITVAPIEGVLVSATIDETLSFSVAGVTADAGTTGTCGVTRTASSPDTLTYSVPWGTISPTYLAATHNTSQLLTVSTNADGGYSVTIVENDQMGKNGVTCTGGTAGESVSCIQDTTCHATPCDSQATTADWGAGTESFPGLGYSLEEVTAAEAAFEWDDSGTWLAKQIPDSEAGESATTIMTNAGPVDTSQVYVCYRIDVTATQPSGYYFNKVRYTATAVF